MPSQPCLLVLAEFEEVWARLDNGAGDGVSGKRRLRLHGRLPRPGRVVCPTRGEEQTGWTLGATGGINVGVARIRTCKVRLRVPLSPGTLLEGRDVLATATGVGRPTSVAAWLGLLPTLAPVGARSPSTATGKSLEGKGCAGGSGGTFRGGGALVRWGGQESGGHCVA